MIREDGRLLHVFYVQSEISHLVCNAIVRHQGLAQEDVLFVLDRGQSPRSPHPSVLLPPGLGNLPRPSWSRLIRNRKLAWDRNSFVATSTRGRAFRLYANRMNQQISATFIASPKCRGFDVYEEGFMAYWRTLDRNGFAPDYEERRRWSNRFRYLCAGLIDPGLTRPYPLDYGNAYATSPMAFADYPRRIEVELDVEESLPFLPPDVGSSIPVGGGVFALPLPYAFLKDVSAKERLIGAISGFAQSVEGDVFLKPHPDRYDHGSFWEEVITQVSRRVSNGVSLLTEDLSLEALAFVRPDVTIGVIVSSLAIYANILRAPIHSFAPMVLGEDHWKVVALKRVALNACFHSR